MRLYCFTVFAESNEMKREIIQYKLSEIFLYLISAIQFGSLKHISLTSPKMFFLFNICIYC